MKKIMTMFLAVTMSILMVVPSYATSPTELSSSNAAIDEDLATTLAALFVGSNLELEDSWTMATGISDVEPLFDENDNITAYCVKFYTNDENTGYVVISTDISESLIQEYSADGAPIFEATRFAESEPASKECVGVLREEVEGPDKKIYYAGAMRYSTNPDIFDSVEEVDLRENVDKQELAESNNELIKWISESGTLKDLCPRGSQRPRLPTKKITDPLVYLKEAYPLWAFTNHSYHNIGESAIQLYTIKEKNACAIYSTAAIVKYYVGNKYTFESIKNTALSIMRGKSYYRGGGDYYLHNLNYKDFVNSVLRHYGLGETATNRIAFAWDKGIEFISKNRPIMVNLWNAPGGAYSDHTVTAYAWTQFTANNGTSNLYRFFKIRDGEENTGPSRYVYMDTGSQLPWYITTI